MNEDVIKNRIEALTEELKELGKKRISAVQLQQDIVNRIIQVNGAIQELKKLVGVEEEQK